MSYCYEGQENRYSNSNLAVANITAIVENHVDHLVTGRLMGHCVNGRAKSQSLSHTPATIDPPIIELRRLFRPLKRQRNVKSLLQSLD